ncbi:MAG: DNA mismatch repair endonuclease MutL [Bacteroidales bacterium]|nr:DNA mismatch repair endonuclease MutL [Bacteroidales bacterium]
MAINILDQSIANQIAAGEVVNRPASVVKELVENAIDAGSSSITLSVTDAGRTLIEVIDDGCGMDEADAQKCFLPHATSKIQTESDLRNLTTMGFRGEALASIAAIAQVELRTKTESEDLANEVIIEGGVIKSVSKTTARKGTDIKVKNIFFNVPARRNFLKSDQVELSHINEALIRIALINNHVSFTYIQDSHTVFKLEKANFKKRITDLFGQSFNKGLLPISEKIDLVEISGFISTVDLTRKNKNDQYFFVNNRFMRNPYFANAVERAYQNLIAPKNYPVFFIHLKVNPKDIDVNIHPTKTEIKFVDDKIIYSVINSAVRKVLGQTTLASTLDFEKKPIDFPLADKSYIPSVPTISDNRSFNPFSNTSFNKSFDSSNGVNNVKVQTEISFSSSASDFKPREEQSSDTSNSHFPTVQFLNKYIITQLHDSLLLINQFKASKKIYYEQLTHNAVAIKQGEKLLIPYEHKFSQLEIMNLKDKASLLQSVGFEFEIKDDNTVSFTCFPQNITSLEAMNAVEDIINETDSRNERLLAVSERLAIKEGRRLTQQQIVSLVQQLFKTPNPEFLPMNERVFLRIDEGFLNKFFF